MAISINSWALILNKVSVCLESAIVQVLDSARLLLNCGNCTQAQHGSGLRRSSVREELYSVLLKLSFYHV